MSRPLGVTKFLPGIWCAALLASGVTILNGQVATADGRRDLYFQQATERYFNLPQNARTFGMAGSSVATSTDVSSVIGNPAGIGMMQDGDISFSYGYNTISGNEHPTYAEVEQQTNYGSVLATMPIGPVKDDLPDYGNIGLGWSGYQGDLDDDTYGVESKGYRIHGTYGIALSPDLSVGYGLSYLHDDYTGNDFEYPMKNGFRHTVGALAKVNKDLSVGGDIVVGHGRHKAKVYSENLEANSDLIEVGLDLGAAYMIERTTLTASADYQHYGANGDLDTAPDYLVFGGDENGNAFAVRLGIEQNIDDLIALRAGYRYQSNSDYSFNREGLDALDGSAKYNAFTLGLGATLPVDGKYVKKIKLDYGVEYREVAYDDWEHLLTVSVPFGVCQN
jgi:opacity protein-like surface antigen